MRGVVVFWVMGWLVTMVVYGPSVHALIASYWHHIRHEEGYRPYAKYDGWLCTLLFWPVFMTLFVMYGRWD